MIERSVFSSMKRASSNNTNDGARSATTASSSWRSYASKNALLRAATATGSMCSGATGADRCGSGAGACVTTIGTGLGGVAHATNTARIRALMSEGHCKPTSTTFIATRGDFVLEFALMGRFDPTRSGDNDHSVADLPWGVLRGAFGPSD